MTTNRAASGGLPTRQIIVGIVFLLILIFILWQVWGMLKGSAPTPKPTTTAAGTAQNANPAPQGPHPAQLPIAQQSQMISPQQFAQLAEMQQDTMQKYLAALNELQMLKLQRDIAEANKAIMAAKLDTVTAEKGIVDILKPTAPPPNYAQNLSTETQAQPTPPPKVTVSPEVNYTVISVAQLQQKWSAVLGYQGALYNVSVGDQLPADGSNVIAINKQGVTLEKDGVQRKVTLVPII